MGVGVEGAVLNNKLEMKSTRRGAMRSQNRMEQMHRDEASAHGVEVQCIQEAVGLQEL